MRTPPLSRRCFLPLATAAYFALGLSWAAIASARVTVQLLPANPIVTPGAEFDLTIEVPLSGSPFNAYHLLVGFDPSALTLVPLSPLRTQVGPLVSNACGTLFHMFHQGVGVDSIDVSMLCASVSVTGPGTIYRLRFRASDAPQVTTVRILPDATFANAGIAITDVVILNAAVGIGLPPVSAGGPAPEAVGALAAAPNPSGGAVQLSLGRPLATAGVLAVHDLQGRELRRLELARGVRAASWDGSDASGRRVPPGQYLITLHAAGAPNRSIRVTQVR